jgi:hypothetical protein
MTNTNIRSAIAPTRPAACLYHDSLMALSATVVRAPMKRWPMAALAIDVLCRLGGHTADEAGIELVAATIAAGYPAAAALIGEDL